MGKKSTHVKTYELRQNDLCIMLEQLDPASNKNYGKILHKVRQFVRFVYVANGCNEIIRENV